MRIQHLINRIWGNLIVLLGAEITFDEKKKPNLFHGNLIMQREMLTQHRKPNVSIADIAPKINQKHTH